MYTYCLLSLWCVCVNAIPFGVRICNGIFCQTLHPFLHLPKFPFPFGGQQNKNNQESEYHGELYSVAIHRWAVNCAICVSSHISGLEGASGFFLGCSVIFISILSQINICSIIIKRHLVPSFGNNSSASLRRAGKELVPSYAKCKQPFCEGKQLEFRGTHLIFLHQKSSFLRNWKQFFLILSVLSSFLSAWHEPADASALCAIKHLCKFV